MLNREYIKSQIDILPESVIVGISNYINKSKQNAEYISMLERSLKQSGKGQTVTFEIEELLAMEKLSLEETKALIEKARKRGNSK